MKYTHLFTGPDGESHFEDIEVAFPPPVGEANQPADVIPATGAQFVRQPPGYWHDWHHAPQRQFVVIVQGAIELEVKSGEKRRLNPGDVMLAEDVTGRGHIVRNVSSGETIMLRTRL